MRAERIKLHVIRWKGTCILNNFPHRLSTIINSVRYVDVFSLFFKKNACEHVEGIHRFMASPQCLGYSRYRTVTRDLCFPPKQDILNRTEEAVRKYKAKAVFVATDNDPMLEELKIRLKGLNVRECREIIVMITAQ